MSSPWVIAAPEYVAAAASDLANIGSSLSSANMAALMPTSGVLAAGGDEVSAMIAALFSSHAQAYQALSAQAASFHAQFVQLMNTGASHYALTRGRQRLAASGNPGTGRRGRGQLVHQCADGVPLAGGGAGAAPVVGGGNSASAASVFKPTPAASVPIGGVTPLTGTAAANASNFAATGGSGAVTADCCRVALPRWRIRSRRPARWGAPVEVAACCSTSAAINADAADGGTVGAPVASPAAQHRRDNRPQRRSASGSAGVSETSGNGGTGRLGSEASGGEEDSAGVPEAGGGSVAAGTFDELRPSGGSFYGSGSDGGGGAGTGAAAALPS